MRAALLLTSSLMKRLFRLSLKLSKRQATSRTAISELLLTLLQRKCTKKLRLQAMRASTSSGRTATSLQRKKWLTSGQLLLTNILSSLSKTVLPKRIGTLGSFSQISSARRFSSLVMTCLLQTQRDLRRVLNSALQIQSLSRLTRSVL